MGCVSSALLSHDDEFAQIAGSSLDQHIVSLTSTTYGFLTLDPPPPSSDQSPTLPPTPPPRFTLGSVLPSPLSEPRSLRSYSPEVINSWELMAGLDATSPLPLPPLLRSPKPPSPLGFNKENSNPNFPNPHLCKSELSKPLIKGDVSPPSLDGFEKLCPPNGENRVVLYTTTLRGVRKTFEECNAVRAAIEGVGVLVCERDISMDRRFREELRELLKGKGVGELIPPRMFVNGRYLGGAEEVMRIVEDGYLGDFLKDFPRLKAGFVCEGCGGVRFLPCFRCNGSCKMVMVVKEEMGHNQKQGMTVVVRCPDCNENGLVRCSICN